MQIEGFVDNTEAASIFELYLLEVDIDLISKYTKIYYYEYRGINRELIWQFDFGRLLIDRFRVSCSIQSRNWGRLFSSAARRLEKIG